MMYLLSILGEVESPTGTNFDNEQFGIVGLMTTGIRMVIIFAGLYVILNFLLAGIQYITSEGEPQKLEQARKKIYSSIIGLGIIVVSFIFAAILGMAFFQDPTVFLSPKVYGPGAI